MEIGFYEEFPSKENLEKLKLIKFRTRIFVAAHSTKEFKKIEKNINKIKRVTVGYWPLIKNSYWISPFSNTRDLIKNFRDMEKIKNPLLIDLEYPLKNPLLILKNIPSFYKNKKIIGKFMKKNSSRITTAEYSNPSRLAIMGVLGLSYNIDCEKSPMFYTSMKSPEEIRNTKKHLLGLKNKNQYVVGLGAIAIGIQGNEPLLSPENLEKDLRFVKRAGFDKVLIFRLGGLNKDYIKILNKFGKKNAN